MLTAITLLFLALAYFVDTVRARALAFGRRSLDRQLSPVALASSLQQAAGQPGAPIDTDALRDIASCARFLSGTGILALFDAPWLPVYLARHRADASDARPLRRRSAPSCSSTLGVLNRAPHARPRRAGVTRRSRASLRTAEALARNAEAIVGMGMTRAAVARWQVAPRRSCSMRRRSHVQASAALGALARVAAADLCRS